MQRQNENLYQITPVSLIFEVKRLTKPTGNRDKCIFCANLFRSPLIKISHARVGESGASCNGGKTNSHTRSHSDWTRKPRENVIDDSKEWQPQRFLREVMNIFSVLGSVNLPSVSPFNQNSLYRLRQVQ